MGDICDGKNAIFPGEYGGQSQTTVFPENGTNGSPSLQTTRMPLYLYQDESQDNMDIDNKTLDECVSYLVSRLC